MTKLPSPPWNPFLKCYIIFTWNSGMWRISGVSRWWQKSWPGWLPLSGGGCGVSHKAVASQQSQTLLQSNPYLIIDLWPDFPGRGVGVGGMVRPNQGVGLISWVVKRALLAGDILQSNLRPNLIPVTTIYLNINSIIWRAGGASKSNCSKSIAWFNTKTHFCKCGFDRKCANNRGICGVNWRYRHSDRSIISVR